MEYIMGQLRTANKRHNRAFALAVKTAKAEKIATATTTTKKAA